MKNYILIPYDNDEALFNSFGFDEFILPLANYSIGFEYYFSIFEINELAKKSELTEEEKEEQKKLRQEYIDEYIGSLKKQLDNTYIVDENGNKEKLKKK